MTNIRENIVQKIKIHMNLKFKVYNSEDNEKSHHDFENLSKNFIVKIWDIKTHLSWKYWFILKNGREKICLES